MKITTPFSATVSTAATATGFNNTNRENTYNRDQVTGSNNRLNIEFGDAEELLTNQISEQEQGGKQLIKFCRELSAILIRSYKSTAHKGDIGELREKLTISIIETLDCTEKQALCLIELSLELMRAKQTGRYKRSEIELGYLIATATGAVCDVSSN